MLTDRLARPARLRAPQESGEVLVAPAWDRAGDLIAANAAARDAWDCDVQGTSLRELALAVRQQVLAAAAEYTRTYAAKWVDELGSHDPAAPIILAGHQPELFHPGVWLKHIAIGRLAEHVGGTAVNLIIDADDVRSTDIRVPTGPIASPRVESIPYDLPLPPQPYEERPIRDRAIFASFGERATECISPLVDAPFVSEFWPIACERSRDVNLGQSIAQARHLVELAWGNRTLELPQSRLCRLPAVRTLVCHLLANLQRLRETYNAALAGFRLRHAIKNRAQPMPDLDTSGAWLEAPLWIWSADQPARRRLFACGSDEGVELSDRRGWTTVLPLWEDGDAREAAGRLDALEQSGVKIRSRALVTTLIARLLCGDLFVHGIGGARYDEVTDEWIREFFGCPPPQFTVVSGTLHLPIDAKTLGGRDIRDWQRRLRDLTYHPEVHIGEVPALSAEARLRADALSREKRQWIAAEKTPPSARARHLGIENANRQLQAVVGPLVTEAADGLADARRADHARQLLGSRDYAFCLYPRQTLGRLLNSL